MQFIEIDLSANQYNSVPFECKGMQCNRTREVQWISAKLVHEKGRAQYFVQWRIWWQ